jgi:AbrB family looped-hinge helix DNA binding protein
MPLQYGGGPVDLYDRREGGSTREERVRMSDGGRIVIPQQFREAMGVKPGDDLVLRMEDNCLRVYTLTEAVRQSQAIVRRYVASDRSLAGELIRDRKREAEHE